MQITESERVQNPLWKKWGPYLSERQWGTVREDYSEFGAAWNFLPHDHARSRAYRWGEDGIAGICDDSQRICFAFAFWNGKDAILKERIFGLTGVEGNRNEDVKEYYFYADATPSASYLKYEYKYPHQAFPYAKLVEENGKRAITDAEFELADTDIFNNNAYFNCIIEYAKAESEDILIKISLQNRADKAQEIHLLPTAWFRNTWSWEGNENKPTLQQVEDFVALDHPKVGDYQWFANESVTWLFTENETNATRLFGLPSITAHVKDAFHEYLIEGRTQAVNPLKTGTKAAGYKKIAVPAGQSIELKFRLRKKTANFDSKTAFANFDIAFEKVKNDANVYYDTLQAEITNTEHAFVQRQALAGLVWGKQFYEFNAKNWLNGDANQFPPPEIRKKGRNATWKHLDCHDIISMPDKWEYPWFAAWDTAFHAIPFAHIDSEFAKNQIKLFVSDRYMSPQGQIPAYEWAFGDVNPPVCAYGALKIFEIDKKQREDEGDLAFLSGIYSGLFRNYQWWLATQTINGEMLFGGGFMGLDNVSLFDRGRPLANSAKLIQADSAAWMALFSLNLMLMALKLSQKYAQHEADALYFAKNFLSISKAINQYHWNDKEGVYGDFILNADGTLVPLPIRSIVGLSPIFATEFLSNIDLSNNPSFVSSLLILATDEENDSYIKKSEDGNWLFATVPEKRLKRMYYSLADESRYLSKFGIRSLSKEYEVFPFTAIVNKQDYAMKYKPAESETADFGENSNWRGPIWFPVNYVLIDAFYKFGAFYGDKLMLQYPHFPIGIQSNFTQIAKGISQRLISIFEANGKQRPVYQQHNTLFKKPDFNENVLFYEYFDGDTGKGCGASHQTGWTALVADLIFLHYQN
ncbi:MAG: MGH1-like glycoside hydrolase domain-containing protein [Cytophagales bacterium]